METVDMVDLRVEELRTREGLLPSGTSPELGVAKEERVIEIYSHLSIIYYIVQHHTTMTSHDNDS